MIKKLLIENYSIHQGHIIIKTDPSVNHNEIFDQIRAIQNVVVLTPVSDDLLNAKSGDYTLLKIKFLVPPKITPVAELERIREIGLRGNNETPKIRGLLQVLIKDDTISKLY